MYTESEGGMGARSTETGPATSATGQEENHALHVCMCACACILEG